MIERLKKYLEPHFVKVNIFEEGFSEQSQSLMLTIAAERNGKIGTLKVSKNELHDAEVTKTTGTLYAYILDTLLAQTA